MKRLITFLLFITSISYGQSNYVQVGNTLQQKDTTINGITQKTYRTIKGSTGNEYFPTKGWILGQNWAQAASASRSGYVSMSDQSLGAGVKIMKGILSDGAVGGYGTGRTDAQLEISNQITSGHTLLSLYNHVGGGEESAISYGARLSNGTIAQQGAGYIRYVNDDDTFDDYRTVYGFHLPDSYGDKNPFLLFSNNSVHLLSGNTSALPWNTMPDDNTLLISGTMNNTGLSKLGGGLRVSTDNSYTSTTTYSFRDGLGINNPNAFPFTTDTLAVLHIGSMTSGYSANAVGKYLGAGFEVLNGSSNHFLKANGGVDSTVYAINSSVVHKTGSETVSGEKTLTDKLILTRVGGQSSLQGTTDLALDGTTLFLNAYTNGDVNINLGGGKVVTNGLDTYGSDLSGSYTARTKIDKGYADATYAAIGSSPTILTGSATINFGAISGNSEVVAAVTVTGAAIGDVVSIGLPFTASDIPPGVVFTAYVSAANQVSVRANNTYTTTSSDPPSGTFTVKIIR